MFLDMCHCTVKKENYIFAILLHSWIDTTFLDKDLRIGRGDKGSVFVSVRAKNVDS